MVAQLWLDNRCSGGGLGKRSSWFHYSPELNITEETAGKNNQEAAENNDEIVSKAAEDHIWSKAF